MEKEKGLHPRNKHIENYNFKELISDHPSLSSYVKENKYGDLGVDFSDANAVLCLNQALLSHHYKIEKWTIPKGHLCPAIPGRVDYIHHIADLLGESHNGVPPVGTKVKGLDVGTGTSCIYPLLGNSIYGWKFVGTDISTDAINHVKGLLSSHPTFKKNIKTRYQDSPANIFVNMIKPDEKFDFSMCNPPFYSSLEEANSASDRKSKNLNKNKVKKGHSLSKSNNDKTSNFGGLKAELWCPGGEKAFILKMIKESNEVKEQCRWFTTLVSKKDHLEDFYKALEVLKPSEVRTIEMQHGQKNSRILAWHF